MITTVVELMW